MADQNQIIIDLIKGLQTKVEKLDKKQEDFEKSSKKHMNKIEKQITKMKEDMIQLVSSIDIRENVEYLQETVDIVSSKVMNISKTVSKLKTPCDSIPMSDSDHNNFMAGRKRNRHPRLTKSLGPAGQNRVVTLHQDRTQLNCPAPKNDMSSDENPSNSDSDQEKVDYKNGIVTDNNLLNHVKPDCQNLNHQRTPDSPVQAMPPVRPPVTTNVVVRNIQDMGGAKISGQPQERDFEHVMEELGLERNRDTIAAVCKAGEEVRSNIKITGMNTVCIFDISSSMNGEPITQLRMFMDNFIQGVEDAAVQHTLEEKIAIITCGATTTIAKHFTNDYQQVRQVAGRGQDGLQIGGRTPLMTALVLAFCYIELHGEVLDLNGHLIYPRIILISDGMATNDSSFSGTDNVTPGHDGIQVQTKLFTLGKMFRQRRYPVYCIGVGQFNKPALEGLAKMTGGQLVSHIDGQTVGKYYWHQTMAGRVFSLGFEIINSGGRLDINQLLDTLAVEHHLSQEDKAVIKAIIDRESQNSSAVGEQASAEPIVPTRVEASVPTHVQVSIPTSVSQPVSQPGPSSNTSPAVSGDWTVTVEINNYSLEEMASLPPLGTRVTRGPHWKWGDQDGNGSGTVVRHVDKGKVTVCWDNGNISDYRYGLNGTIYDLTKDSNYRQVVPGQIEIGCCVVRGPEWSRGDEDGGEGTHGMVLRKLPDRKVMVRWPCRVIEVYNFGENNKFELEVVTLPKDFPGTGSTNLGAPITSLRFPHRVTDAESTGAEEGGVKHVDEVYKYKKFNAREDMHESVPCVYKMYFVSTMQCVCHMVRECMDRHISAELAIWQWEDRDKGWRIFNKQSITKIETMYSRNSKGNVMAKVKNKNVKIFLESEQYEFPHSSQRGKIRRRMVTPQEQINLDSVEETFV